MALAFGWGCEIPDFGELLFEWYILWLIKLLATQLTL